MKCESSALIKNKQFTSWLVIAYQEIGLTENTIFKVREKKKCRNPGSNQGPLDLQSNALPTELFRLPAFTHIQI